jgi:hypothetical protein
MVLGAIPDSSALSTITCSSFERLDKATPLKLFAEDIRR